MLPFAPPPPSAVFTLEDDPTEYRLLFDFNHLCEAESATKLNLMNALALGGVSAGQTRGLLFACLKTWHPVVELDEVGSLLTRDMPVVLEALSKALESARGIEGEEVSPAAPSIKEETPPPSAVQ